MAVSYVPPPNALMMTGDNGNMLAVHGDKKLGVFPSWHWEFKTVIFPFSGQWGGYAVNIEGRVTEHWMVPWQAEVEIDQPNNYFMKMDFPGLYVMYKGEGEQPDDFAERIAQAELLYGVTFTSDDKSAAAEAPYDANGGHNWPCRRVISDYYVVLSPVVRGIEHVDAAVIR